MKIVEAIGIQLDGEYKIGYSNTYLLSAIFATLTNLINSNQIINTLDFGYLFSSYTSLDLLGLINASNGNKKTQRTKNNITKLSRHLFKSGFRKYKSWNVRPGKRV